MNPALRNYRIPAFADIPRSEVFFADTYDKIGPLGAKSQGECAINPVAPAIANAIKNATGVRFTSLPFTAARIYSQLANRGPAGQTEAMKSRPPADLVLAGVQMSAPAVLIASAKLRPGEGQAFAAWQARHNVVVGKFPGFISSDVVPPSQPEGNEWTMVLNFRSQDELTAWQRSSERAEIVGEAIPLFEGGSLGEVAQPDRPGDPPGSNVTEVILSKIKPGMDDAVSRMGGQNSGRPG